jgi:hypothetical protein
MIALISIVGMEKKGLCVQEKKNYSAMIYFIIHHSCPKIREEKKNRFSKWKR